jgi:predicted GNAT family N-acyltransferase
VGPRVEAGLVGRESLPTCIAIRHEVFVIGQSVPKDIEVDGLDEACTHALVRVDGVPVATARLRVVDGLAKVERVAVLESHRGGGYGRVVMDVIEEEAVRLGLTTAKLNAQTWVIPFYERLGYVAYGPEFMDADIPHRAMKKPLG